MPSDSWTVQARNCGTDSVFRGTGPLINMWWLWTRATLAENANYNTQPGTFYLDMLLYLQIFLIDCLCNLLLPEHCTVLLRHEKNNAVWYANLWVSHPCIWHFRFTQRFCAQQRPHYTLNLELDILSNKGADMVKCPFVDHVQRANAWQSYWLKSHTRFDLWWSVFLNFSKPLVGRRQWSKQDL